MINQLQTVAKKNPMLCVQMRKVGLGDERGHIINNASLPCRSSWKSASSSRCEPVRFRRRRTDEEEKGLLFTSRHIKHFVVTKGNSSS
jgi:hypothetical protein